MASIMFFISILLTVVLCCVFFLNINKTTHQLNITKNSNNVLSSIDECIIGDNYVYVKGWATPVEGIDKHNTKTTIFLMGENLTFVPKSTVSRPDVSSFYKVNGKYNDSGFEASLYHEKIKKLGNKIFVFIERNNNKYVVAHDCKK